MTKKTQKHEEKLAEHKSEISLLKRKNEEHEGHIDRLTKQLLTNKDLKSKLDEANRENEFMKSKLRFLEKNGGMSMTGSIGMTRMSSTTTRLNMANTQMDDEVGEEFNNTYLKDLKSGSDFSLDKQIDRQTFDVCSASVLQQRNSMYPQHMRGSYAVISLDRNVGEEEMRVSLNIF
jgi:predicted RNase H-like nuclease (RuvC/YqgF family)